MLAMVGKQVLVRDPPYGLFVCAATVDFGFAPLVVMNMCVWLAQMDVVVVEHGSCGQCGIGAYGSRFGKDDIGIFDKHFTVMGVLCVMVIVVVLDY